MPPPPPENTVIQDPAHLRRDSSRSVPWLSGELDIATAATVREGLASACRDASAEVIVDLSHVSFFDAVTVRLFAQANDQLNKTGGRLTLLGLSPLQEKVLRICGLDHLLAVAVCRSSDVPSGHAGAMS
jgi:anti-sigma B factor antagonist